MARNHPNNPPDNPGHGIGVLPISERSGIIGDGVKTAPADNRGLTTALVRSAMAAQQHTVTMAQLASLKQPDGTRWSELLYQLIRDGHLVVEDGIAKAVGR